MNKPTTETHFLKKMGFVQGVQTLYKICRHLNLYEIDNILFGKWAAALYVAELNNMGPYVLLIPQVYLHEKKDVLDKALLDLSFTESKSHKFIYEYDEYRVIFESQAILSAENQLKRNTVWRESSNMTFKTRSASSILYDYEEANKPEHDEIRKKLRAYIDSRKYITRLAANLKVDLNSPINEKEATSSRKIGLEPIDIIYKLIQSVEESIYSTPIKPRDDLAEMLSMTDHDLEQLKKLGAKRILAFQSLCERLNIQSYLLRFYDITNRFKSFVCIEILLNDEWYLIDLSVYQTTVVKTKIQETDRYLNSILKSRGVDCFEINLGDIEQEMHSDDDPGSTIMLPDFA